MSWSAPPIIATRLSFPLGRGWEERWGGEGGGWGADHPANMRFAVPGFLFEETHLREIRADVCEVGRVQIERKIGVAAAVPVHLEAVGVFGVVHSSIHEVIRAHAVPSRGGKLHW